MKAEQWADGGRSSATPPNVRARRSSPLQQSPLRRPKRKKPAHFPTVEIGFRSIIIFLPCPRTGEDRCSQTTKRRNESSRHGRPPTPGVSAATSSCQITFICSARRMRFRQARLRIGSLFGKITSREHGHIEISCRFGSGISGTGNYDAENRTPKNGNMWRTT